MFLKRGSRGQNVRYLQYGLNLVGAAIINVDGIFGTATYNGVRSFQNRFRLDADGIVGNNTWSKLCSEVRKIQQRLKDDGYLSYVDGVAGPDTWRAIVRYREDHHLHAPEIYIS